MVTTRYTVIFERKSIGVIDRELFEASSVEDAMNTLIDYMRDQDELDIEIRSVILEGDYYDLVNDYMV